MIGDSARALQVAFSTRRGQEVMARLDFPRGRLRAYALFAHCLGPEGDEAAEAFVEGLLEFGLGVLSFELTAPEPPPDAPSVNAGPEDEPPLALDAQDLVDAALELRASHAAPELLIGHSLAGAAALLAALELREVRGVATIAAPSDVTHMQHLLEDDPATVEARGEARVWIKDRFCRVRASFLEELEESEVRSTLLALRRPLLVTHSPHDNVIGVDNARRIFDAARHPKSFVSLAGADHDLTNLEQAHVAGELVGAWAASVLPPEPPPPDEWREDGVAYARTEGELRTEASAGGFPLLLDEATSEGGSDAGPSPLDLLCTSLASSVSMTLRRHAGDAALPLVEVTTRVSVHEEFEDGSMELIIEVRLVGEALTEQDRKSLLAAVGDAPTYRALSSASRLTARLV